MKLAALIMAIYANEMCNIYIALFINGLFCENAYLLKLLLYSKEGFLWTPWAMMPCNDLSRQFRHSSPLSIFYDKLIDIYVAVMPF